jgi:hypothetical protein
VVGAHEPQLLALQLSIHPDGQHFVQLAWQVLIQFLSHASHSKFVKPAQSTARLSEQEKEQPFQQSTSQGTS